MIFSSRKLVVYFFCFFCCLICANLAYADGAYTWRDSRGRQHFGSNPPKDAIDIRSLAGKSFSRYSSEKLMKPYARMALSETAMEKKIEESIAKNEKTAKITKTAIANEPLDSLSEQSVIPELQSSPAKIQHDEAFRVTACEAEVKNTSSLPASNVIVVFEFEDGSLVPGVGPDTIEGEKSASYQIPKELLPVVIKGAEDRKVPPTAKVDVKSGNE